MFKKIFKPGIEGNIWKFTLHAITNKRTYMTFMTIFLLTFPDTTAKTIGLLTMMGQIAGFLLEVPSGYISDRIGHKRAMVLARISLVLSTACYVFADDVWWFFAGTVLLSIGWSFVSGTGSALMHDTLASVGKDHRYSAIMGRVRSIGFAVPIIFIILLPILAETDFRLAFTVALGIDIVGLIAVLLLKQPAIETHQAGKGFRGQMKQIFQEYRSLGWLPYVIFGTIITGISFGISAGFKNPFQESLGITISMLGVLWAISRVMVSSLLLTNGWIYRIFSFKRFLVVRFTILSTAYLLVGLVGNQWLVAAFFIIISGIVLGTGSASTQYHMDYIKGSPNKATLLSMNQLLQKGWSALVGLGMGYLVVSSSYPHAYVIAGGTMLVITFIGLVILPRRDKRKLSSNTAAVVS